MAEVATVTRSEIARRDWHAMPAEAALRVLGSAPDGLSDDEARTRLAAFGANALPRARPPGVLRVYLRQFTNPLVYLLLAAAAISAAIGETTDAIFIFAVLQFNALVGTVQEWRAQAHAESLNALVRSRAVVLRAGQRHEIDSEALVPGDVLALEAGALVTADIRLLSARELETDESLLTGESTPVAKQAAAALPAATPVADRANLVHAGTVVLRGRARGVVTATGIATEIGRIARALATGRGEAPPLVVRLERFSRSIAVLMGVAVALIGAALFVRGMDLTQIFFVGVALAVAAIPEGLPVAITVALAVATDRMARRNVIVRQLPAVEGLGACTLIASDKTGTLTCNELTARRIVLPDGMVCAVSGEGYRPDGEVSCDGGPPDESTGKALLRLATAGALCNEAEYHATEDGAQHVGDTVDIAFLALAEKLKVDRPALHARLAPVAEIPYEPRLRFAATAYRDGERILTCVKGAAEVIAPMCRDLDTARMARGVEALAADGYRVLAVAAGESDHAPDLGRGAAGIEGLDFLGLVGLIDPLRPEAEAAVRTCHEAGIEVVMVTGDHPVTALAIARELGIAGDPREVMTGAEMAEASADELQARIGRTRVFARVDPMQKLTILRALHTRGHFIAMTGDGVNDAPALREANIGVAMGRHGTDIARDAADLILADDNFASIVAGVHEGRIAYDNVRKLVYLLIATGAAELVLFFLAIAANLPIPLFALQLLWLNIVTNGIQDVALAFEKGEPGILRRSPRPPDQPIFDRAMITQTAIAGSYMGIAAFLYFAWCLRSGMDEASARNAVLLLMVLFENAHVFNSRSERRSVLRVPVRNNPWVVGAVLLAQAVHVAVMVVPGYMQDVLGTKPLEWRQVAITVGLALSLILVMELYKLVARPRRQG